MDSEELIKEHLLSLTSVESIRKFVAFLGYSYQNQPIQISDPELSKIIRITKIAESKTSPSYPIILVQITPQTKISNLDREIQRLNRNLYKKLPEYLRTSLLIFTVDDFSHWHFVYAKEVGRKNLFRRFVIGRDEKIRTAVERLSLICVEPTDTYAHIIDNFEQAFDREALSDDFFKQYQDVFFKIKEKLIRQKGGKYKHKIHLFLQIFLNRLMFVYYIQKKKWLLGDTEFVKTMWIEYQNGNYAKDSFHSQWLNILFFNAFNDKFNPGLAKYLPERIKDAFGKAPFLNGGLFYEIPGIDDQGFELTDEMISNIIDELLEQYNFTIQEDTPFDQHIAVNPEMLGTIFESLVNVSELTDERHQAGIFYTPRIEVDFMVRRSIVEYLYRKTKIDKDKLYEFVFYEEKEEKTAIFNDEKIKKIKGSLEDIKIVDPACGSGAFLVGAMHIILELKSALAQKQNTELDRFDEKKKIIERSLYGVDVKDWAVEVAKLRLWLELLVDADETKLDIKYKPLLPSLSFKLREGDSLVQEIGGIYFPVKGTSSLLITPQLKRELTELKKLKTEFYYSQTKLDEQGVRKKELGFYRAVIDNQINELKRQRTQLGLPDKKAFQQVLFDAMKDHQIQLDLKEDEKLKNLKEKIDQKIQNLQEQKTLITEHKKAYWTIEFADVFAEKDGFDIVIANPPYVRQELISDPYKSNSDVEEKREYKEKLLKAMQDDWFSHLKIEKRADLYVYFYLKGLRLLNPDGVFCYISSNSWLDVGYGKDLQKFLLDNVPILAIYDNQAKRSFKQADVNTIIAVFGSPQTPSKVSLQRSETTVAISSIADNIARFVMFKKPFEEVLSSETMIEIEKITERKSTEYFRVTPIKQSDLLQEGLEIDEEKPELHKEHGGIYIGNKWGGKYLRAPDIFFTILEKGKNKLVHLGDIADLERGLVTGLDTYIFLSQKEIESFRIEKEFLKKVFVSPRQCNSAFIMPSQIETSAIYTEKNKNELKRTNILDYIKSCEKAGALKRATAKDKNKWYIIRKQDINFPCITIPRAPYLRFPVFIIEDDLLINDMVIIQPHDIAQILIFASVLISTLGVLLLNISARQNLGLGTLKFEKVDAIRHFVLSPECFASSIANQTKDKFTNLSNREIKSIFEECGINPELPIRSQEPNPLPDRKELDDIIFDILGLTKEERKEVYWSVCELVKNRLQKARSV